MNDNVKVSDHQGDVRIQTLQPGDIDRWDGFVLACDSATFFHRAGWKDVIERAFGHKTFYMYAEHNGKIEGVLPLGQIKSLLFGNALMSTPFCVYGGIASKTERARQALEERACQLAQKLNVDYLEMRNLRPAHKDWQKKDLYVDFRKEINSDPEENMRAIPRKQRAMVRKGIKAGLAAQVDDEVDRLYCAYSESVHNLGTPVFSKKYFEILKDVFAEDCEILSIVKDGRLISSVMSFYFRDEVLPYYGGGTQEARSLKGNDFMYWELMRHACEKGIRIFDFGRSKQGAGSYNFKKNWGFEPKPLFYEYCLVKSTNIPDVNPMNPKYRLFINAWKRLPLSVTRWLGPAIARNLG